MIYDGVLAHLLGIDMEEVRRALFKQFGKRKAKAADLNWNAAQAGYDYAAKEPAEDRPVPRGAHGPRPRARSSSTATPPARWAAMFAGVTVVTWYPITPSSSLVESLIGYLKRYRIDQETGKATFAVVQAEDELAAIGMAIGAGWAARGHDRHLRPGHLADVRVHRLGYYAEIPAVIFDVQRVGPSTGLPTRTMQGDMLSSPPCSPTATPAPHALPVLAGGVLHHGRRRLRPGRGLPDAGVRDDRPRPRHEQLDVRPVRLSREAHRSAARC
jgi:2-oxoglutarate/2-oxoacid ferredoxin oxidoreductase subunit alpha